VGKDGEVVKISEGASELITKSYGRSSGSTAMVGADVGSDGCCICGAFVVLSFCAHLLLSVVLWLLGEMGRKKDE